MTQVTEPFPIFYDDDGTPLENGMIYIGQANQDPRTNPVTVYRDDALTIPIAQPIRTLDGRPAYQGSPVNLFIAEAEYSITVQNKRGAPIVSADDAFRSAAGFSFIQAGTGAVRRSAQDKMREIISVKDFGAVGDGVTDDTAEIAAAIAYAATLAGDHPVSVYFPAGDYNYTSLTITSSRVQLVGTARLVKTTTTGNGITFDGSGGQLVEPGIGGLTLGSASAASSGALLKFLNCIQIKAQFTIKPFPAACFDGAIFEDCSNIFLLEGTKVQNCLNDGVTFKDCLGVNWVSGRSDACGRDGVVFSTVSGVYVFGVECFSNTRHAFKIDADTTPTVADLNGYYFFTNCIGDTSGNHNWSIKQAGYSSFVGCWGSTQSGSAVDAHGFLVDGCFEIDFDGCIALANNGCGMRAVGGSANITVDGGRFLNNGQEAGSAIRAGISLAASCEFSLSDVRMSDRQMVKTQQRGLQCDATVAQLSVSNCDMRGNAAAPYLFAAQPALFTQSNNLTGETGSYGTATTVTISPFLDVIELNDAAAGVFDIVPKWRGRNIAVSFVTTATIVSTAGGGNFLLPTATIIPGAGGTASFIYNGTNWLCTGFEVNDNA